MFTCAYKYIGKISISINGVFFIPKDPNSPDDLETAERARQFEVSMLIVTYVIVYYVILQGTILV